MTDYRLTDPQGNDTYVDDVDILELLKLHPITGCIMAACDDAAGWVLTNLTTGSVTDVDDLLRRGY